MYRIIGVFEGSDGKQHLKLIKYKPLDSMWHSSNNDVDWSDSDLYAGLNGSYFLTNTTYDYLQNSTWLNKIENWIWSAVNTKTLDGSGGPNYYDSLSPSQIYLHEMNRSSKTSTIGAWSTSTAKIGLMYVSDYALSLGDSALAIIGGSSDNKALLLTGWMHYNYTGITDGVYGGEWTMSRLGIYDLSFYAWHIYKDGVVSSRRVNGMLSSSVYATCWYRPVIYLTSDVRINGGSGEYSNPYILE